MKALQAVLLIAFVYLCNLVFPAISDLLKPTAEENMGQFYPIAVGVIVFTICFTLGIFYLIHYLNKIEGKRDDARIKKIVEEVFEKVKEERDERNKPNSEHFQSVL